MGVGARFRDGRTAAGGGICAGGLVAWRCREVEACLSEREARKRVGVQGLRVDAVCSTVEIASQFLLKMWRDDDRFAGL